MKIAEERVTIVPMTSTIEHMTILCPSQKPLNVSKSSIVLSIPSEQPKTDPASALHVYQDPLEYLVSSSPSSSILQQPDTYRLQQLSQITPSQKYVGICDWRNELGDLFYLPVTHDTTISPTYYQILVYTDNTTAPENITKMEQWVHTIHSFLWSFMQAKELSISSLYEILSHPTDKFHYVSRKENNSIASEQLFKALRTCGCPASLVMADEEWFTFYRMLHALSIKPSTGVTLTALRTFLIDPFHSEYWRRYLSEWTLLVSSTKWDTKDQVNPTTFEQVLRTSFDIVSDEVDWKVFAQCCRQLHSRMQWPLSELDLCRLLYHFDTKCNGQINASAYQQSIRDSVRTEGTISNTRRETTLKTRNKLAVSQRPTPHIDTFSTESALHKLYQARGNATTGNVVTVKEQVGELLRYGNTRLAQIRNLPVSQLVSEGVHFRPQLWTDHTNNHN